MKHNHPIILDCDPGEDDALAILYALRADYTVKALICGFGNTSPQNTIRNGAGLLTLAGCENVPLFRGTYEPYRSHPIENSVTDAGDFVGRDGMCDTPLPKAEHVKTQNDAGDKVALLEKLADHVKSCGPITYILTGPCGTLAHLLDILGTDAAAIFQEIIVMGGALDAPGNHGPINPETEKSYAEFNFYCDPYGTERVLQSGIPITIVPWDLTENIVLNYQELKNRKAQDSVGAFVVTLMTNFLESYGIGNNRAFEFNDCITFTAYEGAGTFSEEKIRVITHGEQAGRIVRSTEGSTVRIFDIAIAQREFVRDEILRMIGVTK